MSLLEEILSGIKRESPSGDVPPNLKRIVSSSMTKQRTRRRAIFLSAFALIMVGVGYGAILLFETVPNHLVSQNDGHKVLQALQGLKSESFEARSIQSAATSAPPLSPPLPHADPLRQETRREREPATGSYNAGNERREPRPQGASTSPAINSPGGFPGGEEKAGDTSIREAKQLRMLPIGQQGTAFKPQPRSGRSEPISVGMAEKDLHLYTAKTYEAAGDFGRALAEYKKALEWENSNYLVLNNIAGVLIRLGLYGEATEYAERSIAVKKDYVPSLVNLAVAYLKSGESESGAKWLLRALQLAPTDRAALSNLALLYERAGEYVKSYDLYRRLAAMDDSEGHLGMARVCEKENRAKEAAAIYRNILKRDLDKRTKKFASDRLAAMGTIPDSAR